jgi:hypothetical protein
VATLLVLIPSLAVKVIMTVLLLPAAGVGESAGAGIELQATAVSPDYSEAATPGLEVV